MANIYTMDEAAQRLHKSRRWLVEFVRGKAIGRLAGRTRLFTETDFEKLRLKILHDAIDRVGQPLPPAQGHIYFIEAGDFIKIGFTRSPVARVRKMLTDSPHEIRILHAEPGTFKQEKLFHRHFSALRVRREWFQKSAKLLEFIEDRKRIAGN